MGTPQNARHGHASRAHGTPQKTTHGQASRARGTPRDTRARTRQGRVATREGTPPGGSPSVCILLAGGLRPSPLVSATGHSVLDLWLTPDRTVLDHWVDRVRETNPELPVRVIHDARCPTPWPTRSDGVSFEQDPKPLRGTAGILRDVCRGLDPDERVFVAEASRYAAVSLQAHVVDGSDVTVMANADGTPAGIYIIRCATLELIPPRGFVDLKEQWIPRVQAAGHSVRVVQLAEPGVLPLRTRREFLAAARISNPLAGADLRVVCPGGLIGPGATVIDSIVMPGAVVGAGAVVVRSLLCPDTRTQPGADIVDSIVQAG